MQPDLQASLRRVMTTRGAAHTAAIQRLLFDLRQSLGLQRCGAKNSDQHLRRSAHR
jgi:hypothetical protein